MSGRTPDATSPLESLPAGARAPAETEPHARTLVAWPTEVRREQLWGDQLGPARELHALIARAIARFEPVTLVVDPSEVSGVGRHLEGSSVEIVEEPIDDSWLRDSGPVIVKAPDASRHALCFQFTGWGGSFSPFDQDATIAARLAARLDLPSYDVGIAGEGGALALDGAGTVVTTTRCLLNPNRNPGRTREEIDAVLQRALGVHAVVWLADGIAEDEGTDGHVDNVVAFFAPGRCLLQGCNDPANPNHEIARANRVTLERAGVEVTEVPVLAYANVEQTRVPVPYVNLYPVNGAVLVPVAGDTADAAALALIGRCYPGRDIIGIPGAVLAYGGGGVHCITQPVPA
jgi:agmatine deiminase